MKSPFSFIVKAYNERRYDNIKNVGGVEFITSVSKEDHTSSNRFAIVVETPVGYKGPIQPGDQLLVHHNVFKYYNDMKGVERSGKSYFKDDLFFVDMDQFFMYHNGERWQAHSKYCFIKPVDAKDSFIFKRGEEPLVGIVKYGNKELEALGVKEGDEITFEPESEYPFFIDGEKLYRMFTKNIMMVL
mgnify:FL=1|tara:strand:+ start:81 stop:641 length:561 start_codon:yes stop_codon:yes gene_type:complete